ncbi:MAG: threonine synthase [Flavobacteriales bacterium]|nr:threonine synthase [Flavobacteriales bacterium]MBO72693.1 threonine synthase [Flavobacteriales bacterium]|tara:strand:+ start:1967 stop:3259 length:1293 start_codon:yes stop_codon:yes gene_type:complete
MKYYSTRKNSEEVSFKDAVIRGLAPDGGLYFPERIDKLPEGLIGSGASIEELGYEVAKRFVDGEIPDGDLQRIVEETVNFPLPIVEVEKDVYSLELWHGPTCAFKDVGGRFLGRCLSHFVKESGDKVTILVATSGDTGSAVASGFLGVEGIDVVILYPKGLVSKIQEQQLTTMGQNISTLEVEGSFDDCQAMVKQAFNDPELRAAMKLSSANSINVARFLPQSFYYFGSYEQLEDKDKPVVYSCPSGNFGNLTAGMFAKEMGLPIARFIGATNANDVVPEYLRTGVYKARPSIPTISNAMDIGDPSNFVRILELHGGNWEKVKESMVGYAFSDEETKEGMLDVISRTGYLMEPHGVIGYMAVKEYQKNNDVQGVVLETAHPAKFGDVVEPVIGQKVEVPERLQEYMRRQKVATLIQPDFDEFKQYLLQRG